MDARSEFLLMATVAVVDGDLNWQERTILSSYASHIGLSHEDAREMLARLTEGRRVAAVSPDDDAARGVIYQRLVEVAMVDGRLLRSELNLLKKLAPAYKVRSEQLRAGLGRAKRWLAVAPEPAPRPVALHSGSPWGVGSFLGGLALVLTAALTLPLGWLPLLPGAIGGGLGGLLTGLGGWLWWRARRLRRRGVPAIGVVEGADGRPCFRYSHEGESYRRPLAPTAAGTPADGEGLWVLIDPAVPRHALHWWRPPAPREARAADRASRLQDSI